MKILKIHFDPPSSKYGTGNFILNFSSKLTENSHDVTNVCCRRYVHEKFDGCNIILCSSNFKKRLPFFTFLYEFLILEVYSSIHLLKNLRKYDHIITYGEIGFLASIICKIFKKTYIKYFFILYKDLVYLRKKEFSKLQITQNKFKQKIINFLNSQENYLRICLESYFLRFEQNFITGSSNTKKRILKKRKKNILVNYYYHNLDNHKPRSVNFGAKKKLLLIGNDIYLKGLLKFLNVLKLDYDFYFKNVEIFIIGVSNQDQFKSHIKFLNLEKIIKMYPHTNKIENFYENIDLFVNLSLIEGWNISIMDAYLKKIKIFSTNVGCVNEVFRKDDNVTICCKYNLKIINNALMKAIVEKKEFNNNHYNILKNKLEHNSITEKYIKFLNKLKNE